MADSEPHKRPGREPGVMYRDGEDQEEAAGRMAPFLVTSELFTVLLFYGDSNPS